MEQHLIRMSYTGKRQCMDAHLIYFTKVNSLSYLENGSPGNVPTPLNLRIQPLKQLI